MNISEIFVCDTDGQLIWNSDRPISHFKSSKGLNVWRAMFAGKQAGFVDSQGYVSVEVGGKTLKAHRIIWELLKGPIPIGVEIDHINGVRSDNRICNLRLATQADNARNRSIGRNNSSGIKGVQFRRSSGKWIARISVNRKDIFLGSFSTKGLAALAYTKAAIRYHGEFSKIHHSSTHSPY